MPSVGQSSSKRLPGGLPGVLLNPYFILVLGGCLAAAGELLLKKGANSAPPTTGLLAVLSHWFGVSALASGWTWLGILSYICGLLCWLYVLQWVPLSIAFTVVNVLHMAVPVGAWLVLHEPVPLTRWIGIGIAVAGVLLILKPVARAEEEL